jgi:hypothetical protein
LKHFPVVFLCLATVAGTTPTYFPADLGRELESEWAPFLSAAREAPFVEEASRRAYRVVYRPSWRSPIVATVETDKGQATLHVKVLDGRGATRPGHLVREYSRRLRGAEWDHLSEALKAGFWAERSIQQRDVRIQDGSGCLIEGTRWGEYHVAAGWNPLSNRFRAACRAFLNLTFEDTPVTEFEDLVQD